MDGYIGQFLICLKNLITEVIITIKRIISLIILILLLSFMVIAFTINQNPSTSTTLATTRLTTTDNHGREIITTSYVDKAAKVTVASDKGYASYRVTKEDGRKILEEYLDETGEPICLAAGYSSIERKYEDGLNTTITYLGLDGQPVVITNGYDSIHRTYNDQRLADTDTYYVSGEQVTRKQGYASLHRIYGTGADIKRIVRQEYRNLSGNLVTNSSGYAYLTRTYNSLGKVETELYFGTNNEPVAIGSGYCGFNRTYNEEGRINATTYLDKDGKPINTKYGYATIKNEYTGEEIKRLYFDDAGVATTGTHGEYGYTTGSDGKKIYLDSRGESLQRLDIFLNSNPIAVLILGAVFTLLALLVPGRKWQIAFLIFYIGFIYLMTLAWREGIDSVKSELFWSYKQFLSSPGLRREIINNVFLFIPFGCILLRLLGKDKVWMAVLICLTVSAAVETVQLTGEVGTFEFDDMISNGIGGIIGAVIATMIISTASGTVE